MPAEPHQPAFFATDPDTNWESLLALRDPEQQREAMTVLLRDYKEVILQRVVRSVREAGAEDAYQDFVAWVLAENRFVGADREKGKFRKYLATILTNWLANRHRAAGAERLGGEWVHVELTGEEPGARPPGDEQFDRDWALELLRRAVRRGAKAGATECSPREVLQEALGRRSPKALEQLKTALREELRAVCRQAFIEDELYYLMQVLMSAMREGCGDDAGKEGDAA